MTVTSVARALTIAAALAAAAPAAGGGKSPAQARSLFETKCAPCHGKAGTPAPVFAKIGVPAFSDGEWQKTKSDDQLRDSILAGKPDKGMRAFKDELKPEELGALIRHIRTLATTVPAK